MDYEIIEAVQGSEAWHRARKDCFTASEAPAALGVSKYQKRDELLLLKKTGISKEVDAETQRRFDRGHEAESMARVIAESIIGTDLYPITAKVIDSDLPLLASMDGLNLNGDIGFEHKLLSKSLIEQISNKDLEPHYTVQMDQQILVTGAKKILFMTSDGTEENCHWMWYESTPEKLSALIAGWKQFASDLEAYVPPVQVEKVEAKAVESLPVPSVVVKGELVSCNLNDITPHFDAYLAGINTTLATDQDFADAEVEARNCREMAKKLDTVTEAIISQMGDINTAIGVLGEYSQKLNKMGLQLEKAVKEQKDAVKVAAIVKAKQAYNDHLNELQKDCVVMLHLVVTAPDFAGAIKGVKTIASMQSRINDALAAGKAELSVAYQNITLTTEYIKSNIDGYAHLINIADLATRDIDFIKLHIQSVKDREDARKAAHEAAIVAKAEADARAKVLAEQAAAAAAAQAAQVAEAKPEVVQEVIPAKEVTAKPQSTALRTQPTANQIVELVATHYSVSKAEAHKWLCESDFAGMMKAAA